MPNANEGNFDLQNDTDLLSELEPDWQSAPVGATVSANDGQIIGTVSEKSNDGFYVQNDGGDDYFIAVADIASVGPDDVKLLIASTEVIRARPETATDADSSQPDDTSQPR